MAAKMNENEVDKRNENQLILAALTLGFKELGNDKYECTKEQLVNLIYLSVKSAVDGVFYE